MSDREQTEKTYNYTGLGIWLILFLVTVLMSTVYSVYAQDDAFITYRYARNLVSGNGFVYNLGEPILGTSTPLYTLLLALLSKLTQQPIPEISHTISLLSAWITSAIIYEIGKKNGHIVALTAALLYLTNYILVLSIGMETLFLNAMLLAAIWAYTTKRLTWTAILGGLLILTRYEMGLMVAIIVTHYILENKRLPFWIWPTIVVVAPWLLYAYIQFGQPIPQSVISKLAAERIPFLLGALVNWKLLSDQLILFNLFAFFILLGFVKLAKQVANNLAHNLILIWTGTYLFVASFLAGSFPWYYGPLIPGLIILVVYGIEFVAQQPKTSTTTLSDTGGAIAVRNYLFYNIAAVLILIQLFYWAVDWRAHRGTISDSRFPMYSEVTDWLSINSVSGQSLATEEIGYLGYYTDMRIIDLHSLVTVYSSGTTVPEALSQSLEVHSPDFVLIYTDNKSIDILVADGRYLLERDFGDGLLTLFSMIE
ncbi:MAG: hypothetical protein OEZ02_11165 [Anaerolineae bacterium]|nr:hypothetical protein [Anaerolineae bacterium]